MSPREIAESLFPGCVATTMDELERMQRQRAKNVQAVEAAINAAVEEEREACAKVADPGYRWPQPDPCVECEEVCRQYIAAAIRGRGKP